MEKQTDISVIIPVFNAASCLQELIAKVHAVLSRSGKSFEVILVDDCSKDHSWQIIKEACASYTGLSGYSLAKNFGQHRATLCGFHHCKGEVVITFDDDLEHDPEDIIALYDSITTLGKDVVYAIPLNIKKSLTRRLSTALYKTITKLENPHAGLGSSFRAIKKNLVENITSHHSHIFFIDELILWYTASIGVYQTKFHQSQKRSGYSYPKLFRMSIDVLMISTNLPLKMVKILGLSMSFVSFFIGLFFFLKKVIFKTPAGYTSIIVSILFSAGMILLCLGIIGEYLGNLLMMQNNKPAFYIKDKV